MCKLDETGNGHIKIAPCLDNSCDTLSAILLPRTPETGGEDGELAVDLEYHCLAPAVFLPVVSCSPGLFEGLWVSGLMPASADSSLSSGTPPGL